MSSTGNYNSVAQLARLEKEKKLGKYKDLEFNPVVYGEEKRCPTCWMLLTQGEIDGKALLYCPNCARTKSG